jgi:hypothetical protein
MGPEMEMLEHHANMLALGAQFVIREGSARIAYGVFPTDQFTIQPDLAAIIGLKEIQTS